MSIKIHHGPNGSYKTAGAVMDDLIPAIYEGRSIISNVRGLTRERVYEVLPDAPEGIKVYNLSMESTGDIEKMRSWFTWAPRGAFIIFDETQLLFLKSWTDKYLERFDYPGGPEKAGENDRPINWLDAWTRHRHFNWDIVLTTPRIKYIRDDIRNTCEMAYLHSNLALIGVKGRYKEAMHDAQENKPSSDGSSIVQIKKIKPEVFKLYDSTATGKVQDTRAGKNLFASPRLLLVLGIVAVCLVYLFKSSGGSILSGGSASQPGSAAVAPTSSVVPTAREVAASAPGVAPGGVAVGKSVGLPPELMHPLESFRLFVKATLSGARDGKLTHLVLFEVQGEDGRLFEQTADDLGRMGYRVTVRSSCVVQLDRYPWRGYAYCRGSAPPAAGAPGIASLPAGVDSSADPGALVVHGIKEAAR